MPNNSADKIFNCQFIDDRLQSAKTSVLFGEAALSESVPTVIYTGSEELKIKSLNLAEKVVVLSDGGYLDLLSYAKTKKIDLAGLAYVFSLPSKKVEEHRAYVIIPNNIDIHNEYYDSIMNSIDFLVIRAKECNEEVLQGYKNISKVFVYGKTSTKDKALIDQYCEKAGINIDYLNSLSEIFGELKQEKNGIINFCYKYCLENILYEMSWYLSVRKAELESPLADINDNLLFNEDDKSYQFVKNLQKKYGDNIDSVMQLYTEYRNVCQELIRNLEQIQESFGIKEDIDCINQHIDMSRILLDLILKLSRTYKSFPELDSKGRVRNYCSIYKQNIGRNEVVDVILNDFLGDTLLKSDLEIFRKIQVESIFFKRKKLDLRYELSLENEECAKIIFNLDVPLRSTEKRILGEYYLSQKQFQTAKTYLFEALTMGDDTAGQLIIDSLDITEQEQRQLADFGVGEAAYQVGKKMYSAMYDNVQIEKACLKYLDAIKLLGEISYDQYKLLGGTEDEDTEKAREALHYYLIAVKIEPTYAKLNEVIGSIYYDLENYRDCISYCEQAKTAQSNYLLGRIYELGLGCASDENKALAYYETAINAGHTEAQVAYEKLNSKIEERKKKTVVEENKSYSSYSSYSGYYTSYYSGW